MRYHNITKDDMLNGDGLRVVLWAAGCHHCCKDCQNPVTWIPMAVWSSIQRQRQSYLRHWIMIIFPVSLLAVEILFLWQPGRCDPACQRGKGSFSGKTIWLYTGFTYETIQTLPVMEYVDVLVDGEFVVEKKDTSLYWRGSSNQRVIDVVATRKTNEIVLHCK